MKKWNSDKIKGMILGAVITAVLMTIIGQVALRAPVYSYVKSPDSVSGYNKISLMMSKIEQNYLWEYDENELADYMCAGLAAGLGDKYSTYYTKEDYTQLLMSQAGEYKGIGVRMTEDAGKLIVDSVVPGGPCDNAGVLTGDVLVSINGESLEGKTTSDAARIIRGAESDEIVLEVYRPDRDETLTLKMTRTIMEADSVAYGLDDQVGYIYISGFTKVTGKQFANARTSLEEDGMKYLIIDLRGNPGGLVSGVVETLSNFIPEGELLTYTVDKFGHRQEELSSGGEAFDVPIVVVVDENTASAAEIFTGCVKAYGLGTVIGQTTFGKGIVQNAYPFSDGSMLRLTVSNYYTPDDDCIHGIGIEPDIPIEDMTDAEAIYNLAVETVKK